MILDGEKSLSLEGDVPEFLSLPNDNENGSWTDEKRDLNPPSSLCGECIFQASGGGKTSPITTGGGRTCWEEEFDVTGTPHGLIDFFLKSTTRLFS